MPLRLLFCTIWYMYQMVRCTVAVSQTKDRLLGAAVEAALSQGIVDLSEVERRERERLTDGTAPIADGRILWERLADPSLRAQERLFFEIYSHALLNRPGTEGFLPEVVDGWISVLAGELAGTGLDRNEARIAARLALAVTRGLLLDLAASDDSAGTTQAFELFTRLLEQAAELRRPG
jgi:hypothetical protein